MYPQHLTYHMLCTHSPRIHMCNAARIGPLWLDYDLGEPYTYDRAVKFCNQTGLGLCTRDQYCIGGKGGKLLSGAESMSSGNRWAAVADNDNSWVQTGDGGSSGHKQCWTHEELLFGKPSWGTKGLGPDEDGNKRWLCCASLGHGNTTTGVSVFLCVCAFLCPCLSVYVCLCRTCIHPSPRCRKPSPAVNEVVYHWHA